MIKFKQQLEEALEEGSKPKQGDEVQLSDNRGTIFTISSRKIGRDPKFVSDRPTYKKSEAEWDILDAHGTHYLVKKNPKKGGKPWLQV